jgi:hypothetical protein
MNKLINLLQQMYKDLIGIWSAVDQPPLISVSMRTFNGGQYLPFPGQGQYVIIEKCIFRNIQSPQKDASSMVKTS